MGKLNWLDMSTTERLLDQMLHLSDDGVSEVDGRVIWYLAFIRRQLVVSVLKCASFSQVSNSGLLLPNAETNV